MAGTGKTSVAAKLVEQIEDKFDYVIWRSLRNAPPLKNLLSELVGFLSNEQEIKTEIQDLLRCLRSSRCLVILDNVETILQPGDFAGKYRSGYSEYGELLRLVEVTRHQSCLILTSREKPFEIASVEATKSSLVRSLQLNGSPEVAGAVVKSQGLLGSESDNLNYFMSKFIVYACPVDELATQLELYFQTSEVECGKNTAHKYMPHCTLTGFFEDELMAIPIYLEALDDALKNSLSKYSKPLINILNMTFKSEWHGLELDSPMLKKLIADFAKTVNSPTRDGELRLKDWLHLSLAYGFPAKQQDSLKIIAEKIINIQASVQWELRFYQLHSDWTWTCHKSWML